MTPSVATPCACRCGHLLTSLGSNGLREYLPGHGPVTKRGAAPLGEILATSITFRETARFRYLALEVAKTGTCSSRDEFKRLADLFANHLERKIRARALRRARSAS